MTGLLLSECAIRKRPANAAGLVMVMMVDGGLLVGGPAVDGVERHGDQPHATMNAVQLRTR